MLKKKIRRDFNDKINKKSIYSNNPPDFVKLAEKYPTFKKHLKRLDDGRVTLDWKSNDALKELCRVLLLNDFGIKYWDTPDGYLVPTITSRSNYIHWIHDILEAEEAEKAEKAEEVNAQTVHGLDIGTGANCIYPILGSSIYNWKFKASDINEKAVDVAKTIVKKNKLDNDITIVLQDNPDDIFYNVIQVGEKYDFTMCNPPYFSDDEVKHNNPNTICEFNEKEVYCKGGEYGFITRMIDESVSYRNDVKWFTTLVGRKINLEILYDMLKENNLVDRVIKTTFYQGKMIRWGLAWTFKKIPRCKKVKLNSIDY
jgi:23S rRNA (adenine1618-N6)-methyltransferase